MFNWKYRIHAICILSVMAIVFVPWYMNKPDKNKVEAVNNTALEFLQMIDAGKYADSWLIADPYLQKAIPQQDWKEKLIKIRAALGPIVDRSLEDVNFTAATKELPESEFLLLEYNSEFEVKTMNEVVTVVLGSDNRWRVVGYFVQ